jgi:hypothetical protein
MDILQISAKNLGQLALPSFCPRCFWIRIHLSGQPPFSIFPRIFGDIDRYTKRLVHGYFDRHSRAPIWLRQLNVVGYIEPPSSRKFRMQMDGMLLTGEADGIYMRADRSLVIADYKTAICRGADDPLYPVYEVQLNAYAVIASHLELGEVSELALIYTEPCTDADSAAAKENMRDDGFALGFKAVVHPVRMNAKQVHRLAERAQEIWSGETVPEPRDGCNDCRQLDRLVALAEVPTESVGTTAKGWWHRVRAGKVA